MKVAELMTGDVRACGVHETLNEAARIMWDHDCGCAPVVDGHGKVVGIVTDRDLCMAAYTQGLPLGAIAVERVMSAKVVSCARGDDLDKAHRLMRTHEIHRLPVVDTRGRLLGILSASDLVNHARGNGAAPSAAVEVAATFSAIRRRREPVPPGASAPSNGVAAPSRNATKAPGKKSARPAKSSPEPG